MKKIKPIELPSLNTECYKRIKSMILCGELPWGARIEVGQLASSFGISKFPVIKAIERLSLENLVTISPNRGTYVVRPTIEDVFEVTNIRILIESYACKESYEKLGTAFAVQLDQIESIFTFDVSNPKSLDFQNFLEYDREFHSAIIEGAKNKRLISYYNTIRSQSELFRTKTFSPPNVLEAMSNHHEIINYLKNENPDAAVEALRFHLMQVHRDTIDSLDNASRS